VPPTFPPSQELISPWAVPTGARRRATGQWCPRKLFLITNYCPLELMVTLNHRTLIWGVLSHWNRLPPTSFPHPGSLLSTARAIARNIFFFKPNHTSDTVLFEK
jgi:hypothetical protein